MRVGGKVGGLGGGGEAENREGKGIRGLGWSKIGRGRETGLERMWVVSNGVGSGGRRLMVGFGWGEGGEGEVFF